MENVLFRGMTNEEVQEAYRVLAAAEKKYKKNDLILYAGDVTSTLGIILEGSVTIESSDILGNITILSHAGKGDFFAETYAYLGAELMVDVRANEDCRILFLNLGVLREKNHGYFSPPSPLPGIPVSRTPAAGIPDHWKIQFIQNLLSVSMRKNLILSNRIFHTSPRTIRGKLLAYLHSVSLRNHSCEFDIPFDRQQLADYLNTDRTALSKELGKMRKEGILKFRKNHFLLNTNLI